MYSSHAMHHYLFSFSSQPLHLGSRSVLSHVQRLACTKNQPIPENEINLQLLFACRPSKQWINIFHRPDGVVDFSYRQRKIIYGTFPKLVFVQDISDHVWTQQIMSGHVWTCQIMSEQCHIHKMLYFLLSQSGADLVCIPCNVQ